MRHEPVWNPKKQILYGKAEHSGYYKILCHRMARIAILLGEKTPLYLALLDRMHKDQATGAWGTKWRISEMAMALGKSEKTIDRWLKALDAQGWLTRRHQSYRGRRTYSTYILKPVDELISETAGRGDIDGPTRQGQTCPDKAGGKEKDSAISSPVSESLERVTDTETEAGGSGLRPSPAAPATASSTLVREGYPVSSGWDEDDTPPDQRADLSPTAVLAGRINAFLEDNYHSVILLLGFTPKPLSAVARDMLEFFGTDQELWEFFVHWWPVLRRKLQRNRWIRDSRNFGFGRLFSCSTKHPKETYFQVMLTSVEYDDLRPVEEYFPPGTKVYVSKYMQDQEGTVIDLVPDSLDRYHVNIHAYGPDDRTIVPLAQLSTEKTTRPPVAESAAAELLQVISEAPGTTEQPRAAATNEDDDDLREMLDEAFSKAS